MRRRIKPLLVIIGFILAIGGAIGVMFLLPASINITTRVPIFMLIVVAIYFIVTLIGSKLSR